MLYQYITKIMADSITLRLRSGQARIHSELLRPVLNPKIIANLPVTDGYTKALVIIVTRPE